jgi:thioredoxin 2
MSTQAPSPTVVPCQACGRKNRVPSAAAGNPRCAQCHAPLPWITEAAEDSFSEVVEASSVPVLIDFWAPWCGPCRVVSPALENLARQMAGRLKLVKVNVDDAPGLGRRFSISAVPTLLIMSGGQQTARRAGAAPEHVLRDWVEHALAGGNSGAG